MTTHVDDGALVRYLDEQCEADEAGMVAAHLDRCARCGERLGALRARSRAVSAALRAADPPLPRARAAARRSFRVAAAAVVVLGVAGTVRPVRAWIADGAEALWQAVTGRGARDQRATPSIPDGKGATAVSFVPTDGPFTVEVRGRQAAGTITLRGVPGDTARAMVRGGTGDEDLVILPAGLRIANAVGSVASYEIEVPARLGPIRLGVGDEAPRGFAPDGPPLVVSLEGR